MITMEYFGDINKLQSTPGKNRLPDDIFFALQETRAYFEELEDYVKIRDESTSPVAIDKEINSYAMANGSIKKKKVIFKQRDDNGIITENEVEIFDTYVPNNENEYVIIIVDHSDLLSVGNSAIKPTVEMLSKSFVKYRNRYHYSPVLIQQQTGEKENVEHFKSAKLEPSKDGLSNTKLTYNDCDIAFGIFAPQKHEIKSYRGYNVIDFGDSYRNISVFKNRFGPSNINVGSAFYGEVNFFKELPKREDMISYHYDLVKKKSKNW